MIVKPLVGFVVGCLFATAPVASSVVEISVTVVSGHSPVYRWVSHLSNTFISSVEGSLQGSDYVIAWDEQYSGALAGVGDELETLEEGLAEIGIVPSVFDAAKLGVQNVSYYTPFVSSDARTISELMDDLNATESDMQEIWHRNGVEYLGGAIGIDDYLLMTTVPINAIDDLKGLKIAAPGPAVNWLDGTGAVGVSGNLATYYNDIRTGVYDGTITFASAALPGKLHEVAPYITLVRFGAQYAGGIAANRDWFDALPGIVQEALKKGADDHRMAYLHDLDLAVSESLIQMEALGATVTEVDDAFRTDWANRLQNVARLWAQRLDAEGQPGTDVLEIYMSRMRNAGAIPIRDWDKR
ncbi:MAG: C4-dicarboxylate TRAP transporter substrate-binding protein [Granulosicoccus sp.]